MYGYYAKRFGTEPGYNFYDTYEKQVRTLRRRDVFACHESARSTERFADDGRAKGIHNYMLSEIMVPSFKPLKGSMTI
jgi:hypothetical protein